MVYGIQSPFTGTIHSQSGVNELTAIVGPGHAFETVKPMKLMTKLIQIWCPPNGTVLDPFAGSGTTGHAVLKLNYDQGSDRRFILIEQGRPDNGGSYAKTLTVVGFVGFVGFVGWSMGRGPRRSTRHWAAGSPSRRWRRRSTPRRSC